MMKSKSVTRFGFLDEMKRIFNEGLHLKTSLSDFTGNQHFLYFSAFHTEWTDQLDRLSSAHASEWHIFLGFTSHVCGAST